MAPSAYGARSGSVSCRFGNSVSPVSGACGWRPAGRARRRPRRSGSAGRRDRRGLPPACLDPAELLPPGDGEVVGELLDGERAAGRVGDLGDVGLLDQQGRGVARDPAAERVGQPEPGVERAARSRRRRRPTPAAKAATQVRSMFTQGSYLVIIGRDVTACSTIWRLSWAAPLSSSIRAHSRRTARSLAIVDELLVGGREPELDQPGRLVDRDSRLPRARAGSARPTREHVAELLHVGGAEVVHRGPVDDERAAPELTAPAKPPPRPVRWSRSERQRASRNHSRRRAHRPDRPRGSCPAASVGALGERGERTGRAEGVRGSVEHDGRDVEEHAVEHGGEVGGVDAGLPDLDPAAT